MTKKVEITRTRTTQGDQLSGRVIDGDAIEYLPSRILYGYGHETVRVYLEEFGLQRYANSAEVSGMADPTKSAAVSSYELEPVHNGRKSFYKKARVFTYEDGSKILRSYETDVAKVTADGKRLRLWDWYSATTMRHIHEFWLQETGNGAGKSEWEAMEISGAWDK